MPSTSSIRVMKKLALHPKASQSSRLRALRFLGAQASLKLLERLTSPDQPGRLAALAADMYARRCAEKQLKEQHAKT
jgi:hypothetical protein